MLRCILYVCLFCPFYLYGQDRGTLSAERIMNHLFPAGKAIGQPFTSKQTDIRMLRVESYKDAYDFFIRLCDNPNSLRFYKRNGYIYYIYHLLDNKGHLVFTNQVVPQRNEVAILYLHNTTVERYEIKQIHFVETIKIHKFKR